jgi:hypothetical protein
MLSRFIARSSGHLFPASIETAPSFIVTIQVSPAGWSHRVKPLVCIPEIIGGVQGGGPSTKKAPEAELAPCH